MCPGGSQAWAWRSMHGEWCGHAVVMGHADGESSEGPPPRRPSEGRLLAMPSSNRLLAPIPQLTPSHPGNADSIPQF